MHPFMNERFYWDEFDAALKPAAGLVAVLSAVLVASLTLPATARDAGTLHPATHATATSPTPEPLPACHQMAAEAAAPVAPHRVAHRATPSSSSTPR